MLEFVGDDNATGLEEKGQNLLESKSISNENTTWLLSHIKIFWGL